MMVPVSGRRSSLGWRTEMNLLVILRVALRALARNKARSTLTMLGIVIGVAAVIAMVSIGQGAQASVQEQIAKVGTNLVFLRAGSQNVGGVQTGTDDSGSRSLKVEDIDAIKRELPSVAMVTPAVTARVQIVAGNLNWRTSVQGVSEQFPDIRKWNIATGRFFSDADVATAARVAVIGQTIANNLLPGMEPVGQTIRLREMPCLVCGKSASHV